VLKLEPSLFVKGDLRDLLPAGFMTNVIKLIPIFSDKCSPSVEKNNGDILCITKQGHMFQFDSQQNIVRACNLGWKIIPNKSDKIELYKFLSSNGSYYVVILNRSCCHVYLQKDASFIKHKKKFGKLDGH